MLRLTRNRKSRVSNSLAILAALMLIVSALAKVDDPVHSAGSSGSQLAALGDTGASPASLQSDGGVPAKKNKGFKMSLFLFRHN